MSSLSPKARALVEAGRDATRPSGADRERVLDALRVHVADVAASGAAETQVAAAKGGGWMLLSATAVGLGVAGAALWLVSRSEDAPASPPPIVVAPPPEERRVTLPPTAAPPEPPSPIGVSDGPPASPASLSASHDPTPKRGDRLAEEVALLTRAQKELHSGRHAAALAVLDEHQRKFPRGALAQERLAARIHALCGLGRMTDAEAQLRALNRLSPNSPHTERARAACATK